MTETESKWVERVAQWKASGESVSEYARGREFQASTLRWWSSRIARGKVASGAGAVRMLPVLRTGRAAPRPIVVRVGRAEVEVQTGFDSALLSEVVRVLGGVS